MDGSLPPTGGATRSRADAAVSKVEFRIDGRLIATDSTAPYAYTWKVSRKTSYASHSVSAAAFDSAGQSATSTVSATRVR